MDRGAWQAMVHRVAKQSDTTEATLFEHTASTVLYLSPQNQNKVKSTVESGSLLHEEKCQAQNLPSTPARLEARLSAHLQIKSSEPTGDTYVSPKKGNLKQERCDVSLKPLSCTPMLKVLNIGKFLLWLNCALFLGAFYAREHHYSAKALDMLTSNLL